MTGGQDVFSAKEFQSPRSGQICSNERYLAEDPTLENEFQSPRSGQICSNQVVMANHL